MKRIVSLVVAPSISGAIGFLGFISAEILDGAIALTES